MQHPPDRACIEKYPAQRRFPSGVNGFSFASNDFAVYHFGIKNFLNCDF